MKLVSASIELQALTSEAAKVGHCKDCKALDCSLAKFSLACNTRIAGSLTCSLVAEHAEALPAHQKTWPSGFLLFLFALGFRVAELRLSGRPFVNAGIGASNFKTGQNYLPRNSSRWGVIKWQTQKLAAQMESRLASYALVKVPHCFGANS